MDRVCRNSQLLFLHLLLVLDVIDVQDNFLGGGNRLHLHIHIAIADDQVAGYGELITFWKFDGTGVDMDRICRNTQLRFLHLLLVLDVIDVQGNFLSRFQIIRLAVFIAVLSPNGIQGGILIDAIDLISIDDTSLFLCL